MEINYLRQLDLLIPTSFTKSVTIIGAGATGSYVAAMLSQIGIKKIDVWDPDIIEDHNLPNQIYNIEHIGKPKVEALKEIIQKKCNTEISVHQEKIVDQKIPLGTYVFLLVDSMKSRREIFENCIKQRCLFTDLVIETRLGIDNGRVYAFNPNSLNQVREWESTLYSDAESQTSACGASSTIAPTVYLLASLAVWKLIHHFDVHYGQSMTKQRGKDVDLYNEVIFQVGPENFYYRRFQ